MTVTVKLKDAQGNPVAGVTSVLAGDGVVTVPDTEKPAGFSWREGDTGEYTATYTAKTAGEGLKVSLVYTGRDEAKDSSAYEITVLPPKRFSLLRVCKRETAKFLWPGGRTGTGGQQPV